MRFLPFFATLATEYKQVSVGGGVFVKKQCLEEEHLGKMCIVFTKIQAYNQGRN